MTGEQTGSSGGPSTAGTTQAGRRQREAASLPTRRNKIPNSSETSPAPLGKSYLKKTLEIHPMPHLLPVQKVELDLNWFAPLSLYARIVFALKKSAA